MQSGPSLNDWKNFAARTVESFQRLELVYNTLQITTEKMGAVKNVSNDKDIEKMVKQECLNTCQAMKRCRKKVVLVKEGTKKIAKYEIWKDCQKAASNVYNNIIIVNAARVEAGKKKYAYLEDWLDCVQRVRNELGLSGMPRKGTKFYEACKELMNEKKSRILLD